MPVVAHYIERTPSAGDNRVINGIQGVILAIDDAVDTTAALIRARAVTVLNAQGLRLPPGYFNANRLISTGFATAGKCVVNAGDKIIDV